MIRLLQRFTAFIARKFEYIVRDYRQQADQAGAENVMQFLARQALAYILHALADLISQSSLFEPSVAQTAASSASAASQGLWQPPRRFATRDELPPPQSRGGRDDG